MMKSMKLEMMIVPYIERELPYAPSLWVRQELEADPALRQWVADIQKTLGLVKESLEADGECEMMKPAKFIESAAKEGAGRNVLTAGADDMNINSSSTPTVRNTMADEASNTSPQGPDAISMGIEAIMQEHERPLLRYASRILNDVNAAQDVVQDTFIKLHEVWDSDKRPNQNLSSWLYRVAHNKAVDYIRKESRLRLLHEKQADDPALGESSESKKRAVDREESMQLALEQIKTLEPREQQILVLRLQEGQSYRAIAEITDLSVGNIGYILHHAVKKLSDQLKNLGAI
jgi:RNA polymerase sigma factor (sigma-70 family)